MWQADVYDMTKHSKIVVTGGQGFIGSYILRDLLEAGYTSLHSIDKITGTTLLSKELENMVHWHHCDLLDLGRLEDELEGIEVVIHAAQPNPWDIPSKTKRMQEFIEGTENLVNLSLDLGVKKFIHLSSVAALGIRKQKEDITEKQIFSHSEFDSRYGLGKFLSEQTVWRGHAEGLPVTVLNLSFVLGAGNWQTSSPGLWSWLASRPLFFPAGSAAWVDVRDVADAVERTMLGNFDGNRFIISAENHSYEWVCRHISALVHCEPWKGFIRNAVALFFPFRFLYNTFFSKPFLFSRNVISRTPVTPTYINQASVTELGMSYRTISESLREISALFEKRNKYTDRFPMLEK